MQALKKKSITNTLKLKPDQVKFIGQVRELGKARPGDGVVKDHFTRTELTKYFHDLRGGKLWSPAFITKNAKFKTTTTGVYNLAVIDQRKPEDIITEESVELARAAATKKRTEAAKKKAAGKAKPEKKAPATKPEAKKTATKAAPKKKAAAAAATAPTGELEHDDVLSDEISNLDRGLDDDEIDPDDEV